MRTKLYLLVIIIIVSLTPGLAAAGSKLVTIQVDTPPDIDPERYRRIAVLPFASNAEEYHIGAIIARKITEAMEEKDTYLMESRETVFRLADDMLYDPTSREDALKLGKELGADAVIFGKVEFYSESYTPEGYASNQLYTVDKQGAPPIEYGHTALRDYYDIDVRYKFDVILKVLDVSTGRLVRRREFEETHSETYDAADLPLSPSETSEIVKDISEKVAETYISTLEKHNVEEKRYIAGF